MVAYQLGKEEMPLQVAVGIICKKGTTTDTNAAAHVPNLWAKGKMLDACASPI